MVSARFNIFHVVFALALGMVLFVFFAPSFYVNDHRRSAHMQCLSNLKQLGSSIQIYLSDFDERFPHRTWVDPMEPYTKNWSLFTCTTIALKEKKWGYAMSYKIMGVPASKIANAAQEPVFFEIDALAKDVVANIGARSLDRHPSHGRTKGSNVARADASARFFPANRKLE